jgi:alpha-beta hydrolase superfamily lysophospholipase
LSTFDAPFLVQHGLADRVTDPKLSQALYDEAPSKDKTIRLYDGMWHSLCGEPDENIEKVLNDSIEWILDRAGPVDNKKTK